MSVTIVSIPQYESTHPNHTVPRDGWGRPIIVPKTGGLPTGHVRVTTYIDCIEDKSSLNDWGRRMVLVGASRRPDLVSKAVGLNPDDPKDRASLKALAVQATDASGANDKAARGTYLHTLTEYADRGEPLPPGASETDTADIAAYLATTASLRVLSMETFVVVSELRVGGTFDRLVHYAGPGPDGEPLEGTFIADLKTGSIAYGALKMAAQLAIYSRGETYDHAKFPVDVTDKKSLARWKKHAVPADSASEAYGSIGDVNQEWGIIIHLPAGTATCSLHWVDLSLGWEMAKLAGVVRNARTVGKKAMRQFV